MADIQLRTFQQILGQMISRLLAETDLNDLSPGSVFLTILEAAASSDFTQEGKLLQLLNIRDPDKAKGVDLENLAAELGVTPSRKGATSSNVKLTIKDSAFDKISTNVFAGSVSPASGSSTLNVNDASAFDASGTIFIGRGTPTSEAISYVSVVNNTTFWTFNLSGPLTKDHFVGEEVVMAQGGDRPVSVQTIAQVPSSAASPAIQFATNIDVTLPDGENIINGVTAVATLPGSTGNVGLNKIISFVSPPFTTATVVNDQVSATGGQDTETDAQLRQRIKNHVHFLGRGTENAILTTVSGVTDPDDGKTVVSAFLREPTSEGQLGLLFIDDGTGLKPSFAGVGEEDIVTSAIGTEQFVQLQQFPVVKAQVASIGVEPFGLEGGESLLFEVDGITEQKALPNTLYRTPGVVLAQEIAETINSVFTSVEARAKAGQIFVVPVSDNPDYIRVGIPVGINANDTIRFPVHKQFTVRLYQNNKLLQKNGSDATIQSFPNTDWPPFGSSETLQLKIDNITSPVITVTNADFASLTSSITISGATPFDWAIVLNSKFIGLTATGQDDGTFILSSNRGQISSAQISVVGGSLSGTLIPSTASSVGAASQFVLNRLLGQIELTNRLNAGDSLKAGTVLTEGFVNTIGSPIFDLSSVLGSPAELVVITDSTAIILPVNQTVSLLTFTSPSTGIQRIAGAVGQFSSVQADDWGYFYNLPLVGFVKVFSVAGNGSSVDCFFSNPVTSTATPDGTTKQFVFFRTAGLPQLIKLPVSAAVSGASLVAQINSELSGGVAELLDNNVVQIRTLRLEGTGGLAIPALLGKATNLGFTAGSFPSNDPHIASSESADLAGYPSGRLTVNVADTSAPYDTLSVNGTPFGTAAYNNRPVLDYLGSSELLIREPLILLTTSSMTLREDSPLQTNPIGPDLRYTTTAGLEFGQADNFVTIIDDNPTEKTFDIPMYVDATIAAPAVPTSTQFDAADSTGALLGSSARWLGHRFEDYRVWFKSRVDLPQNVANTGMRITSVQFGPNGKNILFGIFYPNTASSSPIASFMVNPASSQILVGITLGSSIARAIGLVSNSGVSVSSSGPVLGYYTWTVQFVPPVDLTPVLVGDILALIDPNFNVTNRVSMAVQTITNLKDTTRNYQFLPETFSACTVSGGTSFTLGGVPTQALSNGDRITITSITKNASAVGANTITVPAGGAYITGAGSILANFLPYTYTSYNAGTGVFSGVLPDPNGIVVPGNPVTQAVTPNSIEFVNSVGGVSNGTVGSAFYSDGSGFDMTLTHVALTADAAPSFTVAIGDKIQVASQLLTVTGIISTSIFSVDSPFSFTGNINGTVSRIKLTGKKVFASVPESIFTSSSDGVRVLTLNPGVNTASNLISIVNNTAGVQELVVASNSTGSNGSGTVVSSTEDIAAILRSSLLNAESYVYSTSNISPALTLKVPSDVAPAIGEPIRLVPMTPENIKDHFNKKQISGLSIAAEVDLVNGGRHVQISSLTPGGTGQVFTVGGKASGNNVLAVRGSCQQISNSVGVVQLDHSALDLLNPGHLVFLSQAGRAKKNYVGSTPISSTTAQIQTVSPTTARLTFGVNLATTLAYTHTGSVVWAVRRLSRSRVRFEILSGTASLPGTLQAEHFVFVGNGTSYAGTTPATFFSSANQGYFQIRETDASTYFDVDALGAEEYVTASSAPMIFFPYHSARVGDQIVIGAASPFVKANQGTFVITAVNSNTAVEYLNSSATNEGPFTLGSGGTTSIFVLDQGYSTYRTVTAVSPNQTDPTNLSTIVVAPGYDISLLNEGQGATVHLPNRLGFGTDPVPGISGYQFWTGLKRTVQRTLDGYAPDSVTFPGVRAAGVSIEAREPQIQNIVMQITVTTNQGVALAAIADTIKSSVIGYINSLGLGQSVILSEVVSIVQAVSGVNAVVLVNPVLEQELITVNDNAIARTSSADITLS